MLIAVSAPLQPRLQYCSTDFSSGSSKQTVTVIIKGKAAILSVCCVLGTDALRHFLFTTLGNRNIFHILQMKFLFQFCFAYFNTFTENYGAGKGLKRSLSLSLQSLGKTDRSHP